MHTHYRDSMEKAGESFCKVESHGLLEFAGCVESNAGHLDAKAGSNWGLMPIKGEKPSPHPSSAEG